MRVLRKFLWLYCLCFSFGCKEAFTPELPQANLNMLVVEGFIDAGGNATYIKLSRTVLLNDKKSVKPETGALVTVESADKVFILTYFNDGVYYTPPLALNLNEKYRVRIKTADRKEYLSEFVGVKPSPQITKLGWKNIDGGADIYVNTRDANNNTRYYRWELEETWIFYSRFNSRFIWDGNGLRERKPEENINRCWLTEKSKNIILGSSIKLTDDIINERRLVSIPFTSEKFTEKYSILVRQYALSKEEYEFWEELRKNTESLGSIFDAQPSQIVGNIKCINDPNTLTIGYIGAGSSTTYRLFIASDDVPFGKPEETIYCKEVDLVEFSSLGVFKDPNYYPTDLIFKDGSPAPVGYGGSPRKCVDCTLRGVNVKPQFWQ